MTDDLYLDSFELAPVSLWLEDYSALKQLFDRWREQGVTDLRRHLREDRSRVAECSRCLKVLRVNRRTLALFGAADQAELLANLHRVFRDDMFDTLVEEMVQLWEGAGAFRSDTVNYALTGQRLAIRVNGHVLPGHEAQWDRVLVAIEDFTERARAERALRASEQYAKGLFEHSPVSLWVEDFSAIKGLLDEVRARGISDFGVFVDVHPEFVERCMQEIRVIDVNRQTLSMFHAPDKAALLNHLDQVFRDDMRPHFAQQLIDLWNGRFFQQREVVNYALNGEKLHVYMQFSVLPGHEARWDEVLISLTDITARKKAEAYLEYLGKHDVLTGLRNRSFFNDEVARLERRGRWPVSVITVDLNGLKRVNDELGHAAGDNLLRRMGEVLGKLVDAPATACRVGGDEFVLLLPGTDERDAQVVVEQLRDLAALNSQYHEGKPLQFAVGVATGTEGLRLETVLSLADECMYLDKRAFYQQAPHDRRANR